LGFRHEIVSTVDEKSARPAGWRPDGRSEITEDLRRRLVTVAAELKY
jgi:hypothetical protein